MNNISTFYETDIKIHKKILIYFLYFSNKKLIVKEHILNDSNKQLIVKP